MTIARARPFAIPVSGSYTHPNDTAEHTIFEIDKQGIVHKFAIRGSSP